MNDDQPAQSLFDQAALGHNAPEFSVTEISRLIKKTVEDEYALVRVRGEISECKCHSNGHIYLTLKDEGAILASVCWRGQVSKLKTKPEIGMEVIARGRITTYAGQSKYQLVIDDIGLAGIGALLRLLEERKKKLASEGLFDPSRKRPLPYIPSCIGIITSPTGAVIRDILHRLSDRFPRPVLIWPVAVQGEGASEQIIHAIQGFNSLDPKRVDGLPDVLIIARGGGSLEDLMPFNDEALVRAVAASRIPIISAVGHETDITLIDFAADLRAPTPTAAAEMAVPVRAELVAQIRRLEERLQGSLRSLITLRQERLYLTVRALGDPVRVLEPLLQRLDERSERFQRAIQNFIGTLKTNLLHHGSRLRTPSENLRLAGERLLTMGTRLRVGISVVFKGIIMNYERETALLRSLSPKSILERGYTLIRNQNDQIITSSDQIAQDDEVTIEFYAARRRAHVKD